jgi:two-component sensor histidine kinase
MNDKTIILNIDDTEAQLYIKRRDLEAAGFQVVDAMTGADALRLAETIKPPVVLLDVQLPDINGHLVCRYLKEKWPEIMVLMTSATFTTAEHRTQGLDAGADSYLVQPSEPLELAAAVNALLRIRRSEDQLRGIKRALEAEVAQKELLLKEVNHRIKNSLQIVSSILHLQGADAHNADVNTALKNASARVHAIAAVHERLYGGKDIRVVSLDDFLADLCSNIADALGRAGLVEVDLASVEVPTDTAIPLALVVNELLTNALKYGSPPYRVILQTREGRLDLAICDAGPGPATDEKRTGLGSRLVEALAKQLMATRETTCRPEGYRVALTMPLQVPPKHESPDSRG